MLRIIKIQFIKHWKIVIGTNGFAIFLTLLINAIGIWPKSGMLIKTVPIIVVVGIHVLLFMYILCLEILRKGKQLSHTSVLNYKRAARWYVESNTGNVMLSIKITVINRSKCTCNFLPEESYAYVEQKIPGETLVTHALISAPRNQKLIKLYSIEKRVSLEGYDFIRISERLELDGGGLNPGETASYILYIRVMNNFEDFLGDKESRPDFQMVHFHDNPEEVSLQLDLPPGYRLKPLKFEVLKPDVDYIDRFETFRLNVSNPKIVAESGSPMKWKVFNPINGFRYYCRYVIYPEKSSM